MSNYAEQIRNAGLTETLHDNWVDEQERKTTVMEGTITWFEIAKDGLPPLAECQSHSDPILIWAEGKGIVSALYWFAEVGFFRHGNGNWQPTHWAYINNPELIGSIHDQPVEKSK
jgi:hypothetical protein